LLLAAEARGLESGERGAWSFLIPTAGPVEDGVRAVLAEQLAPAFFVSKRSLRLAPTNLTVNPDLVFTPGNAVGDIKYKTFDKVWPRSDLYQSVAFAAAYKASLAIVVSFGTSESSSLPQVTFGDIDLFGVVWRTDVSPQQAAHTAAERVARILQISGDAVADSVG
jgi:5-methylcytosine-specific restriction endonuclease McrBC regulatory subunit McrC